MAKYAYRCIEHLKNENIPHSVIFLKDTKHRALKSDTYSIYMALFNSVRAKDKKKRKNVEKPQRI